MKLREIAARLVLAFNRRGVKHMLTGAVASWAWGTSARATSDVDFIVFVRPDEAADAVAAVEDAGLEVDKRAEKIRKLRKHKPVKIGKLGRYTADVRIAYYSGDMIAASHSQVYQLEGVATNTIPPEIFVVYKLARNDMQDKADVEQLLKILYRRKYDLNVSEMLSCASKHQQEDASAKPNLVDRVEAAIQDWFR